MSSKRKNIDNAVYEHNKCTFARSEIGYWFLKGYPLFFIQNFLDKRVIRYPPKFKPEIDIYWFEYLRRHPDLFCEFLDEYNLNLDFKIFCEQYFFGNKKVWDI